MNAKSARKTPDSALFGDDSHSLVRPSGRGSARVSLIIETVSDYLFEIEYRGQSPRTIEGKRDLLQKFVWWLEREKLEMCGRTEVKRFLHYVVGAHEASLGRWDRGVRADGSRDPRYFRAVGERTIQLYFVHLKTFFGYLVSEEVIAVSPLAARRSPLAARRTQAAQGAQKIAVSA